ncbi:MAG: hypothetical protein IBX63_00450 [Coriobacteriia bacterium]|nr:hypothetical protein [Coriobacteriia bacterium]
MRLLSALDWIRGELVWRWANAHSVAVVVLGTLALGRVTVVSVAEAGLLISFVLLFAHLALANLILARLLLASHPRPRRLMVAAGGFAVSVLVGMVLSGMVPLPFIGTIAGSLIAVTPSICLLAIVFIEGRRRPEGEASKTRILAVIYLAVALVGIFVQSSTPAAMVTGALVSTALHAVWMSALYTYADHGLRLRYAGPYPKLEA